LPKKYSFSSESVTEGHPDKVADQISDAVVDAVVAQDKSARVDCETIIMQGTVILTGQISTSAKVDYSKVARGVLRDLGLDNAKDGIDGETCGVMISIEEQSPDIARGVNKPSSEEIGAGDQGFMFGYATNETPEMMPIPILLAHGIAKRLAEVRKTQLLPYLRPDGKCQVTVDYENDHPVKVSAVVVAAQHTDEVSVEKLRKDIVEHVIRKVVPPNMIDDSTQFFINETGRFVIGGTRADTGLTGRKIMVDSYGGFGSSGGGAFSGKDPTKVDRSGGYMARYIAKNLVSAGLADRCSVQIAYAIGVPRPISLMLDTMGTGKLEDEKILDAVRQIFDLRPGMMIKNLDLLRPIYRKTACYGHFGRYDPDFTWEKTDKTGELVSLLGPREK
jgi:S-adenosylmethionine synthetase